MNIEQLEKYIIRRIEEAKYIRDDATEEVYHYQMGQIDALNGVLANLNKDSQKNTEITEKDLKWFCCAALLSIGTGIKLTEKSLGILAKIREDSDAKLKFESTLTALTQDNEFGITEMTDKHAEKIREFVLNSNIFEI